MDKTGTQGRNPSRKEGTWEFRTARKQKGKRRRKEKRKIRARSICIVGRASAIKSFSHSLFLFLGLNLSKDCFLFLQARVFLPSPTCFWQTFQPSFFFCLATRSFWTGSARSLASNLLAHTTTSNTTRGTTTSTYDAKTTSGRQGVSDGRSSLQSNFVHRTAPHHTTAALHLNYTLHDQP